MISDVLFEAKEGIESYLNDPFYSDFYNQNLRNRLNDLIIKMEEIRVELDTPPDINDHKSQLKELFEKLKSSIKKRCEEARIECEVVEAQDDENNDTIVVSLQDGHKKRQILISSHSEAKNLSRYQFEKYRFLSGYQAIYSYEDNYIEAILIRLEQNSIESIFERLFGLESINFFDDQNKFYNADARLPILEVHHDLSDQSSITISISPTSKLARLLLKDTSDFAISLKLRGLKISQHDETVRYLKDYANAVLFQIDLSTEIPLALKRTQSQEQTILSHYPQNSVEIEYPRSKYDKEAISLYWYARSASGMPLLQYLAYYQIIEFYFPIYSQLKAKNIIQNILKTPGFNVHSDIEIVKILNIAKSGLVQGIGNERKQLEATLQECLNITSLKAFIDENQEMKKFFKEDKILNVEKLSIDANDDVLRSNVVKRIYEIRCRIVHSKTESDVENVKSIYPFTKEESSLKHDLKLVHYIAKEILIVNSCEFKH